MNPTVKRLIWFSCGVALALALAAAPKRMLTGVNGVLEVMLVSSLVVVVLGFIGFWRRVKREAAPAKKSDLIGYGAIAAFCAGIGFLAWRILRQ